MSEYTEGQPVMVYTNGAKHAPYAGEILKVGRVLLTIGYNKNHAKGTWIHEQKFRMETGRTNEEQYGHGTYFKTMEEFEVDNREANAWAILREHGVEAKLGRNRLTVEQLEAMAAIVAGEGA